jgi:transcriptional regulator with GAF, ATPase, and Fis domain
MTRRTQAQAIADAAAGLVADGPVDVAGHLAYLLTDLVEVIGGGSSAGLLIRDDDGRLDVLAASSHQGAQLELFQVQNVQGPCIEALLGNRAVHADTAEEIRERWPRVGGHLAMSCQSLEASPLRWRGRPIGTLNLLHPHAHALGPEQRQAVQTFADIATLILIQAATSDHDIEPTRVVRQALHDRALVEQAKGVLAYTRGIDIAQAYDDLLHEARTEHVPLVELARRVLADAGPGGRPDSEVGPG